VWGRARGTRTTWIDMILMISDGEKNLFTGIIALPIKASFQQI
jgi:hypothetical protein